MWYIVLRRVLATLFLILGVVVLNFFFIHLAPGSPVDLLVGDSAPSPQYVQDLTARLGLDKPLLHQLFIYIRNVAKGDLGNSVVTFEPVAILIWSRFPNTAYLMITALLWSTLAGVLLGVIAATRPHSGVDGAINLISVSGYSVPYFWLGMMLIMLLSVRLDLFPVGGAYTIGVAQTNLEQIVDRVWHLVLPALALGLYYLAVVTRLTRASVLEIVRLDYIMAARAKGLPEWSVLLRHALRNALFPVVTMVGLNLGTAFGGAVLTETVFSYPGIGRVMYDALLSRDYPVMLGALLVVSVAVAIANLLTDLAYVVIDPRVRIS